VPCFYFFGHFINVRKIFQPINNDLFPKTYKTYWIFYLKNDDIIIHFVDMSVLESPPAVSLANTWITFG